MSGWQLLCREPARILSQRFHSNPPPSPCFVSGSHSQLPASHSCSHLQGAPLRYTSFPPITAMPISSPYIGTNFFCSTDLHISYLLTSSFKNYCILGVPFTQVGSIRMRVPSQASLSGLRIWRCHDLWCRLMPTAPT